MQRIRKILEKAALSAGFSLLLWFFVRWDLALSGGLYLTAGLGAFFALLYFLGKKVPKEALLFLATAIVFLTIKFLFTGKSLQTGVLNAFSYAAIRVAFPVIGATLALAIMFLALVGILSAPRRNEIYGAISFLAFPALDLALSIASDGSFSLFVIDLPKKESIYVLLTLFNFCLALSIYFSLLFSRNALSKEVFPVKKQVFLAISLVLILIYGTKINSLIGVDWEFFWVSEASRFDNPQCFPDSFRGNYRFMGAFTSIFISLFGEIFPRTEFFAFFMFGFLGMLASFLTYVLARKMFGDSAGTAAILLSILSTLAPFGRLIVKDYVFQNILSLLFIFAVLLTTEKAGGFSGPALAGVFAGIGIYNKIFFLTFLASFALAAAIFLRRIFSPGKVSIFFLFFLIGSAPHISYSVIEIGKGNFPLGSVLTSISSGKEGRPGYSSHNFVENVLVRMNELEIFVSTRTGTHSINPVAIRREIGSRISPIALLFLFALFLRIFSRGRAGSLQKAVALAFALFLLLSSFSYSDIWTSHFLTEVGLFSLFLIFVVFPPVNGGVGGNFSGRVPALVLMSIATALLLAGFYGQDAYWRGGWLDSDELSESLSRANVKRLGSLGCAPLYAAGYLTHLPYELIDDPEEYLVKLNSTSAIFVRKGKISGNDLGIGNYPEEIRSSEEAIRELTGALFSGKYNITVSKLDWSNNNFDVYVIKPAFPESPATN